MRHLLRKLKQRLTKNQLFKRNRKRQRRLSTPDSRRTLRSGLKVK